MTDRLRLSSTPLVYASHLHILRSPRVFVPPSFKTIAFCVASRGRPPSCDNEDPCFLWWCFEC